MEIQLSGVDAVQLHAGLVLTLKLSGPPAACVAPEAALKEYWQETGAVTVRVTGMVDGEFEAPALVMVSAPLYVPAPKPFGLKLTVTDVGEVPFAGLTLSHGPPLTEAVKGKPAPVLPTLTGTAAGGFALPMM